MDDIEQYRFKKLVQELESTRGKATELISLYVPPGKDISDVVAYLRDELSQSSNIKSKSTRKNVTSAIESLISRLRYYRIAPGNGIAMFVGHKSAEANQTEMVAYVVYPPKPVQSFIYRCDSQFFLDPLKEMMGEEKIYGLLVIDRKEAAIGLLKGNRIETVDILESLVPGKHGRGGQSQHRFERLIEIAVSEFFKKVGEKASEVFLNTKGIEGIIVGGPGPTKDYFLQSNNLHYEITKKVFPKTYDTGYTDEYGLRELVNNAQEPLQETRLAREKILVKRFMDEIIKEGGLAVYGESEVRKYLDMGALEVILISEDMDRVRVDAKCSQCGYSETKTAEANEELFCPQCGSLMDKENEKDLLGELLQKAKEKNTRVELISNDTEEGQILAKGFGGMGAIARFRVS